MHTIARPSLVALALCASALTASAQSAPPYEWNRGTSISGFAGIGADGSHTGALFGGTVAWDLNPRVAFEGTGSWTEYGSGADAFSGSLKTRVNLLRTQRAMPFVNAGVGFYRASFGPEAPMPGFYRRRMASDQSHRGLRATFTDPSILFGGGLNVSVSRAVRIRPEVDVSLILRDSRAHTVPSFRIHLAYVFEDHPVTPKRR